MRQRDKLLFVLYVAPLITVLYIINQLIFKSDVHVKLRGKTRVLHDDNNRRSWEDVWFREYEARRRGPGEQGEPFKLTDPKDIEENEKWNKVEYFSVIVSDKISPDRALPDKRPPL